MSMIIKPQAEWAGNEILELGQKGIVSDSNSDEYAKVGDGVHTWAELPWSRLPDGSAIRLNGRILFREIPDENSEKYTTEIPLAREIGVKPGDSDNTHFFKIGDGIHTWAELPWKTGPQGDQGLKGDPGTSWYDPRIDANGNLWVKIRNQTDGRVVTIDTLIGKVKGDRGDRGIPGEKGEKGDKGTSLRNPTIDENGNLIITQVDGIAQQINVGRVKGDKGEKGEKGDTPDMTGYVKDTDYATSGKHGIIKSSTYYGMAISNEGVMRVTPAEYSGIDTRVPRNVARGTGGSGSTADQYRNPITPSNVDYAVKKVLTDSKTTFTTDEQNAVKNKLGISEVKLVYGTAGVACELEANTFYNFYTEDFDEFNEIELLFSPDYPVYNTCIFWRPLGDTPTITDVDHCITWSGDDVTNHGFEPQSGTAYKIEFFSYITSYCYAHVTKLA